MKQWTKQNMKLLSKLRANKKAAAESQKEQQDAMQRQYTSREMAIMNESQAGGDSYPFDEETGSNSQNNSGSGRPPSVSSWLARGRKYSQQQQTQQQTQSTTQPQQQQPIHHELFYFFLRRSWKKKLFTLLVVAIFIPVFLDLFILQTGVVSGIIDNFLDWMAVYPLLGVWAYIVMLTFASLIFIPPSILIFGAGFTFQSIWGAPGILIALVASFIGSMIGGLIGFMRARYMTRDLIEVLMRRYPIIKAVDAAVVKNSLRVMMLMRLNCLIPFGVLNYAFGITGVDWADFLLAMTSILPWHLLLVCIGAGSQAMYDQNAVKTEMGVILVSTGIAFGILALVITWRHARAELQKEVDAAVPSVADYQIKDSKLSPWRSKSRKMMEPLPATQSTKAANVEDADLHATDYFMMQVLGEGSEQVPIEYGTEQEPDWHYQAKLTWTEMLLDDFS